MTGSDVNNPQETYPWLEPHWRFFIQRLKQDRLAHALLIQGPTGTGKMELAATMVAKLLCRENQDTACGKCRSCTLLAGGAHPDRFNLHPEEGSKVIKVDQVRELIANLDLTSSISMRKVACIYPADAMNAASANALLKSLEEPSGDAVIILVSDNPGRLPVTIRSRCQAISIRQPDIRFVLDWLQKGSGKPQAELEVALKAAGGSPLRAQYYLDSPELDAYSRVKEVLSQLLARPGSVSLCSAQLNELSPDELWRWLSMCSGEVTKARMTGKSLGWLSSIEKLDDKTLLQLQRKADYNRHLSTTQVRGDLLLQDWLIRWAEQII